MSPAKFSTLLSRCCLFLVLSGCGFHPVHHRDWGSEDPYLAKVVIASIANREGQLLRNKLLDIFPDASTQPEATTYVMRIRLDQERSRMAYRRDFTPRHTELRLTANVELVDKKNYDVVMRNQLTKIASFSLGPRAESSSFSDKMAEEKAVENALTSLAQDIKYTILAYLQRIEVASK